MLEFAVFFGDALYFTYTVQSILESLPVTSLIKLLITNGSNLLSPYLRYSYWSQDTTTAKWQTPTLVQEH